MSRSFHPASIDQVLGLLKVVNAFGGKIDIYKIDEEVEIDFDELSSAVNAAESLGLVKVVSGDVELTDLGRRLVASGIDEVKRELAERLAALRPFSDILDKLRERSSLTLDEVIEMLCSLGYCGEVPARRVITWAVRLGLIVVTPDDVVLPGESARAGEFIYR